MSTFGPLDFDENEVGADNIHCRLYADLADGIVFNPNTGEKRINIAAARGVYS